MKFLANLIIYLSAAYASKLSSRIIGGNEATANQFPFMVLLDASTFNKTETASSCGTLLSNHWVLTAAHVIYWADQVVVYIGNNRLHAGISHLIYHWDFEIHEAFHEKKILNDIALIRIPDTEYSPAVKNIQLPDKNSNATYDGLSAISVGWGVTTVNGTEMSEKLKYVELNVLKNEDCRSILDRPLLDTEICLLSEQTKSPCNGDSGGPMIVYLFENTPIQIGILSFGKSVECILGDPVVYTRITKYQDWIQNKMQKQKFKSQSLNPNEIIKNSIS